MPTRKIYWGKHATKSAYDKAFAEAIEWRLQHPTEPPTTTARIFNVKEDALRQALYRRRRRGQLIRESKRGGHNKILSEAQEEAIQRYCYEQWEIGLGATHPMVKAAISHLLSVRIIYLIDDPLLT